MKKNPIGILDEGYQGINVFRGLSKKYKNEDFIYVNDIINSPYEGKEEEVINQHVKEKVDFLLLLGVKAIVVVSSAIVEYCSSYLNSISIPVIRIDEAIIKYISSEFEQKNIALVARESIIKANIYQKFLKYNHLYAIFSDELEKIVLDKKVKTSQSFSKMREACKYILNKEVDIFMITDSYIENLYTEINEYVKADTVSNLTDIIEREIVSKKVFEYQKGRGRRYIYSDILKKEFKEITYWIDVKYKYQLITEKRNIILKELEEKKSKEELKNK